MSSYPSRLPITESVTDSIPASSSGTVTVPVAESMFIKTITTTPGANSTITSIVIDGEDINSTLSTIDTETEYGGLVIANQSVVVTLSNAAASPENSTVEVKGLQT